jgi:hypothetical protein
MAGARASASSRSNSASLDVCAAAGGGSYPDIAVVDLSGPARVEDYHLARGGQRPCRFAFDDEGPRIDGVSLDLVRLAVLLGFDDLPEMSVGSRNASRNQHPFYDHAGLEFGEGRGISHWL